MLCGRHRAVRPAVSSAGASRSRAGASNNCRLLNKRSIAWHRRNTDHLSRESRPNHKAITNEGVSDEDAPLGFTSLTELPADVSQRQAWQQQNRDWWQSRPYAMLMTGTRAYPTRSSAASFIRNWIGAFTAQYASFRALEDDSVRFSHRLRRAGDERRSGNRMREWEPRATSCNPCEIVYGN